VGSTREKTRTAPVVLAALWVALALALLGATADTAAAGGLKCTIKGTNGPDQLTGTRGRDVICARGGNDVVVALDGNDHVFAGKGDDRVDGRGGRDHLLGGGGDDDLRGQGGPDFLYGEAGNDRLIGARGDDALYGDPGKDRLMGGRGENHASGGPGRDVGDPYDSSAGADCPSTDDYCRFHLHLDVTLPCSSYTAGVGACIGRTAYANLGWQVPVVDLPLLFAGFQWLPRGGAKYTGYTNAKLGVPAGQLQGTVPSPGSADYSIELAYTLEWAHPTIRWFTPRQPGVRAGQLGGPLYLNFVNGIVGADMYIDGYLVRA
jgi:Ca2+-binding RTX toxin-like protein